MNETSAWNGAREPDGAVRLEGRFRANGCTRTAATPRGPGRRIEEWDATHTDLTGGAFHLGSLAPSARIARRRLPRGGCLRVGDGSAWRVAADLVLDRALHRGSDRRGA